MILLYHGIVPDSAPPVRWCIGQALPRSSFERQMRWLLRHGDIVSLPEYLEQRRSQTKRRIFALTFDDGMACTFREACPVLMGLRIPAAFFVSTQHLNHGRLLWFSYLNAVCFESGYNSITADGMTFSLKTLCERKQARRILGRLAQASASPDTFCNRLAERYPIDPALAEEYEGMTFEELRELSRNELFEVGAHTVRHPYLSRVTRQVQSAEICESKQRLAELCGQPVRYFAYPGGDYDRHSVAVVKAAGFDAAFATTPQGIDSDERYEIGRTGVYSPALWKVCLKALGMAGWLQRLGVATR